MSSATIKPHTYIADIAHLPRALQRLTTEKRWVVWRWKRRIKNGKVSWTKPPYQCRHPNVNAKSDDPSTWGDYAAAVAAVATGLADGIGFMLKDSEVAAADLDHVRDAQTGELLGWAKRLVVEADQLGLYREVTVSGAGLRFIGLAHGDELHRKFTFNRKSGAGIELYRNCARYITISGLQEGLSENLGPIDDYLDQLVARFDGQPADPFDFNTAGPQPDYFRNLIENGAPEGERSEKFQEAVWHLAGAGWTIEQIVDELARYPNGIGLKYANRLLIEVTRSFTKWQKHRQTSATGVANPVGLPWPQIRITPGELPRVVNEAEDALLLLGREIYQRSGLMVRPVLNKLKAADDRETMGWQLIPVTAPHMVEILSCAAQFLRYDKRVKKHVAIDAPSRVAEVYLARQGQWKLPVLSGIVCTPFLRPDGSLCTTPGYDPDTGLLFKPDGQAFPPIADAPTQNDAEIALERLNELIAEFPFVSAADHAVALSAILTLLDRFCMTTAPLHAFTAPIAGTGKSLLVDVAAMLATGRLMPVIAQGKNEEELEKRLGAALLAGDIGISVDNCEYPLSSSFLCQALTQPRLSIRLLGHSRNVITEPSATLFATGNNLEIAGDLVRRCLLCSMDAGVERPELRQFTTNAIDEARNKRGELVAAALTILRAWQVAGEESPVISLGGFEQWSRRVRDALLWLGCADPCDTILKVRSGDPEREALVTVIEQWRTNLGVGNVYTIKDVIERAINVPTFYTALLNVAENAGTVSNKRLGRWLKRIQGKIVNGMSLLSRGSRDGYSLWVLQQ
jgi:hypothetical protein